MLRPLSISDIPGAMQLKEAAGWNQTVQDWRNLIAVAPQGCFGIDCDGRLAATASAVCFDRELAWIGMVLTDPAFRGRGFARRLMEHLLEYLEGCEVAWVKLDATDMGYALYRRLGFQDECAIERWARPPGPVVDPPGAGRFCPWSPDDWRALDREAFGAGRSTLLPLLASEDAVALPGLGYAMGRPGTKAAYFGPCVTTSDEAARSFLCRCLALHSQETVFWDLLPHNQAALCLARQFGFERRRELIRMARPTASRTGDFHHNDAYVFAIAGFEYG
jgi:GNAT superfamily N-acetyltransferase